MAVKADHVLIGLSVIILLILAAHFGQNGSDPQRMIKSDCALFYSPIGQDAERNCRARMLENHAVRLDAQ